MKSRSTMTVSNSFEFKIMIPWKSSACSVIPNPLTTYPYLSPEDAIHSKRINTSTHTSRLFVHPFRFPPDGADLFSSIAAGGVGALDPAIHPARSKFWIAAAGFAATGLFLVISSNSALASGSTVEIISICVMYILDCQETHGCPSNKAFPGSIPKKQPPSRSSGS